MRVLTWNLWSRSGPWRERYEAIAGALDAEGADIVGLQETWPAQAEDLAARLGYHHVAATPHEPEGFSNAVLSRWPIADFDVHVLPTRTGPPARSLITAEIAAPCGPIPFSTTHLAHRYDQSELRCEQVATIARHIASRRGGEEAMFPPVLVGDLNAVPESEEIRRLTGLAPVPVRGLAFHDAWVLAGEGCGHTWAADNPHVGASDPMWPDRRIDYVLVGWPRPKPLGRPRRAWLVGTHPHEGVVASDHYGVAADLAAPAVGLDA